MTRRAQGKQRFSRSPRKGTKARIAIMLALRPQGATATEILTAQGKDPTNKQQRINLSNFFGMTMDMQGWDYRTYECPPEREQRLNPQGRRPALYKIVGRMRWDGGYRSFKNGQT